MEITQEQLKELFDYREDGFLIWKQDRKSNKVKGQIAGSLNGDKYHQICINAKRYKASRLIWLYHFGELPKLDIDHKNCIRFDNKISNLRLATESQNLANCYKTKKPTSSKFKGVNFNKNTGKWMARITINGKTKYLGLLKTEQEAALAYDEEAKKLFGEFARTNF